MKAARNWWLSMRQDSGFTLIELMIVILIVGVLATIAIPAYENDIARAQAMEALSIAGGLKPTIASLWWSNGSFTGINSGQNGIPEAASLAGHYVAQVGVKNGIIQAVFKTHGVVPGLAGKTLTLEPQSASYGGSIQWVCSSATIDPTLLPHACNGP